YYDTPKRTLWRNGLSLRVRHSGARYTQTVKAEIEDDPFRRGEWEAHVPSMAADVTLAMPFIPAQLRGGRGAPAPVGGARLATGDAVLSAEAAPRPRGPRARAGLHHRYPPASAH